MKIFKISFLLCILFCFFSCDDTILEEELIGGWNLDKVIVNGIDGETINGTTAHFLNFNEDGTYYRTYVTGDWNLDEKNLTLTQDFGSGVVWDCTIEALTEETLIWKMDLTPQEYGWSFNGFDDNEVLTIIEQYVKY